MLIVRRIRHINRLGPVYVVVRSTRAFRSVYRIKGGGVDRCTLLYADTCIRLHALFYVYDENI